MGKFKKQYRGIFFGTQNSFGTTNLKAISEYQLTMLTLFSRSISSTETPEPQRLKTMYTIDHFRKDGSRFDNSNESLRSKDQRRWERFRPSGSLGLCDCCPTYIS